MIIWGVFYNDMIYESADALKSLHTTQEAACAALDVLKDLINEDDKVVEAFVNSLGESAEGKDWWRFRRIYVKQLEVEE